MSLKVRIKAGESLSDTFSLKYGKYVGLLVPDNWTAADIGFEAGVSGGETKPLNDSTGTAVTLSPTAGSFYNLSDILGCAETCKILSGTAALPVAQFGTAASAVLDFGDDRKLTITSGVGGTLANKTVIGVTLNNADTLVVDNPIGEFIRIRLADTTASKNTAAAIQAAIRALGTTEAPGTLKNGLDVSALTVTGSEEYTAAPATFEKASIAVVTEVSEDEVPVEKILTFTAGRGGDYQSRIALTVSVNEADTLAVSAVGVETEEGVVYALLDIKLANQTASKNTAAEIQAAIQALGDVTVAENYTEFLSDLVIDFSAMTVEANDAYAAAPSIAMNTLINGFNFIKEADSFPHGWMSGGDDCWLDVVVKD
jgi:hypothetical protein